MAGGNHTRLGGESRNSLGRSLHPCKTEPEAGRDSDGESLEREEDQDDWEDIDGGDCSIAAPDSHRKKSTSQSGKANHEDKNDRVPSHLSPSGMTDLADWGDSSLTGFYRSAQEGSFKCKAATFSWREKGKGQRDEGDDEEEDCDDSEDISAYTLPPNLKVLKISVEAGVVGDPTALLESYMKTLSMVASERRKTGLCERENSGGRGEGGEGLSEVLVDVPLAPSSTSHEANHKTAGGSESNTNTKKEALQSSGGGQKCLVSYQAPLGDEIHIGQSPRDTQLLGHHRFLGTLHFSPAPPSEKPGGEEKQENAKKEKTDEDSRTSKDDSFKKPTRLPSYLKRFAEEQGVPAWQKEPSFMTWHRVKPYGSVDVSSAAR
ncbi:hypothetical protein CSUI_003582 [Cystoisospora suis]|uniref:Uncharacterized protein n=1 Tax=Cystoisospora suis TaxID=483139 RepID=A0A2C6L3T0_9APIC|nr:hypothetical protein CSUI_003582 [Cystoisospora suis]